MPNRFYIQNRLYNVNDRLAALDLYEKIEQWIQDGTLNDMLPSYLPFKSTNNTGCDGESGIFDMDERALLSCTAVVGYFDGWTYDPGCAFEIGCGYAWGYPVHLISTDIFKSSVGGGDEFYTASKLVEHIAKIVAVADLNQNISDYRVRNEDVLTRALQVFLQNLIRDFGKPKPAPKRIPALPVEYDYYIDPNFKYSDQGRILLEKIVRTVKYVGKTCVVGENQGDIDLDLTRLRQSGQSILYFPTAEPNVDTGILQGFAHGIGRKPIVYADNEQRILMSGKWPIQLNTMNCWSASAVVTTFEELEVEIRK